MTMTEQGLSQFGEKCSNLRQGADPAVNLVFGTNRGKGKDCGRSGKPLQRQAGRFAAEVAGSEVLEGATLLLFDDDGFQVGNTLLQLVDGHILLAEAVSDAGISQLVAGTFGEIAEQHADKDDQDYACPHGHE